MCTKRYFVHINICTIVQKMNKVYNCTLCSQKCPKLYTFLKVCGGYCTQLYNKPYTLAVANIML